MRCVKGVEGCALCEGIEGCAQCKLGQRLRAMQRRSKAVRCAKGGQRLCAVRSRSKAVCCAKEVEGCARCVGQAYTCTRTSDFRFSTTHGIT